MINNFKIDKFKAPKIAVVASILLAISKTIFGVLSGSLAVLTSALDSMVDAFSSTLNYFFIKFADSPPDHEHPFGHGKLEAYAAILQSVVIFATGAFLFYRSYLKLSSKELPDVNTPTIVMMIVAIITSFLISRMLKTVAKKESSKALEGDAAHYTVDVITNAGILLSLFIIKFTGLSWVDPVIAGLMSFFIIKSAVELHISALKVMLDSKIPDKKLKQIVSTLDIFAPYRINYHRLRTRTDSTKTFIDMHMTLCNKLTLEEAHAFADIVETELHHNFEDLDITVHMDPCVRDCSPLECNKTQVQELLRALNNCDDENKRRQIMFDTIDATNEQIKVKATALMS